MIVAEAVIYALEMRRRMKMCKQQAQKLRNEEVLGIGDHVLVDTMLGRIVASDGDMHKVELEGVAIWYDERSITFVARGEQT